MCCLGQFDLSQQRDALRRPQQLADDSLAEAEVPQEVAERVVADCQDVLPADAVISLDSGVHHNWYMQFWKARQPQTMLNTWGFSGMGFGAAGILGAKLAAPDRPCVSICGDGGFMMNAQELETAHRLGLNIVMMVLNDNGLGMIRMKQELDGNAPLAVDFGKTLVKQSLGR